MVLSAALLPFVACTQADSVEQVRMSETRPQSTANQTSCPSFHEWGFATYRTHYGQSDLEWNRTKVTISELAHKYWHDSVAEGYEVEGDPHCATLRWVDDAAQFDGTWLNKTRRHFLQRQWGLDIPENASSQLVGYIIEHDSSGRMLQQDENELFGMSLNVFLLADQRAIESLDPGNGVEPFLWAVEPQYSPYYYDEEGEHEQYEEGYEGYFKVPVAAIFDDFFGMVDAAMSMDEVAPASPDDHYRSIWDSFGAGSGCVP